MYKTEGHRGLRSSATTALTVSTSQRATFDDCAFRVAARRRGTFGLKIFGWLLNYFQFRSFDLRTYRR